MQLLYLVIAGLLFINFTNSKKIKCYKGKRLDLDGETKNDKKDRFFKSSISTGSCSDTCMLVDISGSGKSVSVIASVMRCVEESKCKSNKKKFSGKMNGREFRKEIIGVGISGGELSKAEYFQALDKDVTYKVSVKCCEKDFCNSGSAFGKMGRYFIGSILLATFLILLL